MAKPSLSRTVPFGIAAASARQSNRRPDREVPRHLFQKSARQIPDTERERMPSSAPRIVPSRHRIVLLSRRAVSSWRSQGARIREDARDGNSGRRQSLARESPPHRDLLVARIHSMWPFPFAGETLKLAPNTVSRV